MTKTILITLFFWAVLPTSALPAGAEMRPVLKSWGGTPPFEVLSKILTNSERTRLNYQKKDLLVTEQISITWLSDTDPRINPKLLSPEDQGQVLLINNFGSRLDLAAPMVDYGVRELRSPVLLITTCSNGPTAEIMLNPQQPLSRFRQSTAGELLKNLAKLGINRKTSAGTGILEANIDCQVNMALSRYRDRISSGRLAVVGGIYDFANLYGRSAGSLIIINLNGETDQRKIRLHPLAVRLSRETILHNTGRTSGGE